LENIGKDASLNINIAKTKILLFGKTDIEKPIVIRYEEIENVAEFFSWVISSLQKTTAQTILKEELMRLMECLQVSIPFVKSKTRLKSRWRQ